MKSFSFVLVAGLLVSPLLTAADPAPLPAADLAAKMSSLQKDGSALVKLKLETGGSTTQLQIKQRRSGGSTELVYQVIWPKDRMGEGVLLRKSGNSFNGAVRTLPDNVRNIDAGQLKDPLLGSALAYADVVENFFDWDQQAIVGTEVVDRVSCQILESKPGKGERSPYAAVRTWVDTRRLVPLKVEKYVAGGQAARRITTTRVVTDDMGRHVPANLTIQNLQTGVTTELDGSRLKHGVTFTDQDFAPEGIKNVSAPR
ncbi:MAG: outer membrane lipoprotein-sorting protein [Prosthecobacter sp.]